MDESKLHETLGDRLVKREIITREELDEARQQEEKSGTPWMRQLLQRNKLTFSAIEEILRYEFHPKSQREKHMNLGKTLLNMKAITKQQLEKALAEQERNGRLLGNILLDTGIVDRQTIVRALATLHGMEYDELDKNPSEPKALDAVPENIARKYDIIPVKLEGDKLTVLVNDPNLRNSVKECGTLLNLRINPVMTNVEDIKQEIQRRYHPKKRGGILGFGRKKESEEYQEAKAHDEKPKKTPSAGALKGASDKQWPATDQDEPHTGKAEDDTAVTNETETESKIEERGVRNFEEIQRVAAGAPVIKLVNTIIEGAANSGATDIHLDPQEPEMRVRYRIDGILHDVMSISSDIEQAVVSRLKIMADMDITESRRPQDGHFSVDVGDVEYDIRVATMPTFLGERIVLRLLDQSSVLQGIKDLGLEEDDQEKLTELIEEPYGMILVTGPTGSGKTTTLYACLNKKNVMTDSIVTLEDPVEYQLSGINQVQIDPDINMTFANILRSALRQDIDVLLVGEIRDMETARIAVRAAMTGHLVFSTLHTNDAPEAISTLRNMDVPSYLISSALTAVLGQRLVRCICPECKRPFKPDSYLLKSIELPETIETLYRGEGCNTCYQTGNKGRTGIFEILEVTPDIRTLISEDTPIVRIAKEANLTTMSDRCRQKVQNGIVSPEEFFRVIRT